jgi:adenosylhomocysteine nucleosidase
MMRAHTSTSTPGRSEEDDVSPARVTGGPAVIAVALPWEAAPLARHLGLRRRGPQAGVTHYEDPGNRVLLVQAGMGPGGAARAVACLERPALLLSAGFCGGVGRGLAVGDLVVAAQVARHRALVSADLVLLETATRAMAGVGLSFHVGTLRTVDEVVVSRDEGNGNADGPILAVDMESAHLAEAAQQAGIPFLAIRVVSDTPTQPWAAHGARFLTPDGRLNRAALGAALLRHPSWLPRLLTLAVTLRRATRRLARAIDALLSELEA